MIKTKNTKAVMALIIIALFLGTLFLPLLNNNIPAKAAKTLVGPQDPNPIEHYAVFFGLAKYNDYWYDAGYADVNALSIYELLKSKPYWKEENMKIFLNEEVTKANVFNAIRWLANVSDENDIVLFYFSGHGLKIKHQFNHSRISNYYLSFGTDENTSTDIELAKEFDKIKSKNIAIIFDCCWSARLTSLMKPGRVLVAAGGKYLSCVADWDEKLERGFMTYYLCQGLNGPADKEGNKDGIVSIEEAFRYARKRVAIHSLYLHATLLKSPAEWGRVVATFPWTQIIYMSDQHPGELPLVYL